MGCRKGQVAFHGMHARARRPSGVPQDQGGHDSPVELNRKTWHNLCAHFAVKQHLRRSAASVRRQATKTVFLAEEACQDAAAAAVQPQHAEHVADEAPRILALGVRRHRRAMVESSRKELQGGLRLLGCAVENAAEAEALPTVDEK